ncbi:methyl-accepting chemotaxis protein [uncultured Sphingomonas sp.]|uniref:methyl-accepting chemotaxis protein n=1 Tax=uncultured Sphingomonas sp. TaxID=158754 RepID=UPI0025E77C80|nr:methyl-accepting chemotaxis protein [uncultured Sphingomonas sp.]
MNAMRYLNRMTSLQRKIALIAGFFLTVTVMILVLASAIFAWNSHAFVGREVGTIVSAQAKDMLQNRAAVEAQGIKGALDVAFDAARTDAHSFSVLAERTAPGERRAQFNALLRHVLEQNSSFNGTYSAWEPNAIDGNDVGFANNRAAGSDSTGRFLAYWTRGANGNVAIQPLVEYDSAERHPNGLVKGGWYLGPKASGEESILGPLPYIVQGKQVFLATMSVPITVHGRFVGVSGTDYDLDFLQKVASKTNASLFSGKGVVLIVNNTGLIAANSAAPETIGKAAAGADPHWAQLAEIVKTGEARVIDDPKQPNIDVYSPITLGRSKTPWSVVISVPRALVMAQAETLSGSLSAKAITSMVLQLLIGIGVAVGAVFAIGLAAKRIATPISQCAQFANGIAKEQLDQTLAIHQADEVGTLAEALRKMQEDIKANLARRVDEQAKTEFVVETVSTSLGGLSKGDLTVDIAQAFPSEYEGLKQNFNTALASLRDLIGAVGESTQTIRTGSQEIAQASEDLARRTESNAASLEETSAALVQIDGRLRAGASASDQTLKRADQAILTVQGGRSTADEAMQAMGRVSSSAEGIDNVIEGLDKIAFQTRVLAMNAAVEAGRAGDAGRGFAVVADLVSALAMRAEEEARIARDQLTATQADITAAVQAVRRVDTALVDIAQDVESVHGLLGTMAEDSRAQSAAMTEISAALSAMDQATQQNAAMVEQTSAAARNLSIEVTSLSAQAATFTVDRIGANPRSFQRDVHVRGALPDRARSFA